MGDSVICCCLDVIIELYEEGIFVVSEGKRVGIVERLLGSDLLRLGAILGRSVLSFVDGDSVGNGECCRTL